MSEKLPLLSQLQAITKEMRELGLKDGVEAEYLARKILIFAGQVDAVVMQLNLLIERVEKLALKLEKSL